MNARLSLVVMLLAVPGLSGCGRQEADAAVPPGLAATPVSAPLATADGAVALPAGHYVFGFSTPPEIDQDPRIVDWADGPCGDTAFAAVATMPMHDAVLRPDFVVEFAADGTELHRWGKPYSAEIVTVSGERLHFRTRHEGVERVFWTQADGALGLLEDRLADPSAPRHDFAADAIAIDCPALPLFSGSDYVQCHQVTDAAGTRRLLAWEGACS